MMGNLTTISALLAAHTNTANLTLNVPGRLPQRRAQPVQWQAPLGLWVKARTGPAIAGAARPAKKCKLSVLIF